MDLQKEQDSNTHGSGWIFIICKHWNWDWYWDWKYYIFLTKGGDIVWVTASTKLSDLLITWSRDKCKTLYLHFCNIYGHQIWQSGNLWLEGTHLQSYVTFWLCGQAQMKKTYIWTSTIPMGTKLGRVVTYGQKIPHTKLHDLLITWSRDKYKTLNFQVGGPNPPSHVIVWSRGHVKS